VLASESVPVIRSIALHRGKSVQSEVGSITQREDERERKSEKESGRGKERDRGNGAQPAQQVRKRGGVAAASADRAATSDDERRLVFILTCIYPFPDIREAIFVLLPTRIALCGRGCSHRFSPNHVSARGPLTERRRAFRVPRAIIFFLSHSCVPQMLFCFEINSE